ncbi:MAG: IS701 family transposase [Ktedonobacterales bacterium]
MPKPDESVPAPLEGYAREYDDLFHTVIQRRRFREYVAGLLLPRDRNKTLTALVGAEPITQAQTAPVQQLQWFLSESAWPAEAITARRVALLQADPATRAHAQGALIIDETGDRKDGTQTAHVAPQYLGSLGKIANGIVAVSSLWADAQVYYPLHVRPYTPASRLPGGKTDLAFRTKPQLAAELVSAARAAGIPFRAVVADSLYGENREFERALAEAGLAYVLALKPSHGVWAPEAETHTPKEAAQQLHWEDADHPGDWTAVERRFRDGHEEIWWAADLRLRGYGPEQPTRLVVATTDPARLPLNSTWYLVTNLPLPDGAPTSATAADAAPVPAADLAEVVRLYGLRQWVEQSYKQVKQELGWADFQVRADHAIRRHWALVCCAFAFCWWAELHPTLPAGTPAPSAPGSPDAVRRTLTAPSSSSPRALAPGVGGKWGPDGPSARSRRGVSHPASRRVVERGAAVVAVGPAARAELAGSVALPATLLVRLVARSAAAGPPTARGGAG